jgi:hypothetical protein
MKASVFWDITQGSPVKVNRRVGGIWNNTACCIVHADFLLNLLLVPKAKGDMFPRNVG